MKIHFKIFVLVLGALLFSFNLSAKRTKKQHKTNAEKIMADTLKSAVKDTSAKKDKPAFKTVKEVTDKCKKYSGLFNVYQDSTTGKTYLEINEDKIGKEYIYFAYVLDGVVDAGYARGGFKDNAVFKIERYFDRIDFTLRNTNYYFDSTNALSKSKEANINQPLFYSEKIAALTIDDKSKKKTYLIDADNLFLGENFTQIKPTKQAGERADAFTLGSLSAKKSKYLAIKNYPQNTDVAVEYVYDNPTPANNGKEEVTDARFVSVKLQHALIAVPDNNYKSRFDDPRVGYFIDKINDQTTTNAIPWRDVIHRWNLEKKNPEDKLSEPKKPIVWWIENTTPKEFRPIIKNAVLAWNEAFEGAGFKNAVEC
ncbi:MAG TPA: DUF5117 domain-containing protein, partial [Chitinophagales bacterium]|nr:DUF5117 domain-containing protein [Chitinophagales bacterium]